MEPAHSIARLGFARWYERRLIEAFAWLVTALLCAIYVEIVLEGFTFKRPSVVWLGQAGGMFVGALIVWHGLRRFVAILREAEHFVGQAVCAACRAYGKFKVVNEQPRMTVRCVCSHEWTITA
jgi:hypothetical protein